MANTYHDTPLKDGDGNIHFPRTDLASVHNSDGSKSAEIIIAEQQALIDTLTTNLTANSKKYQADYQDTKYGWTVDGVFYPLMSGAELLWTNSAPTVGFNAQTVALDLSDYVGVAIIARHQTTKDDKSRTVSIGKIGNVNYNHMSATLSIEDAWIRTFKANSTGVVFGTGKNANTVSANLIIPLYIFGLKNMLGFEDYLD